MNDLSGMGRLVAEDARDAAYALPRASSLPSKTYKYWWTGAALDQGSTPHCVAFSGKKYLTSSPVRNKLSMSTTELYNICQKNDEWVGEDYDGTSVRACFKTFKNLGFVSEYRWAYDTQTVVNHLLTRGPVVMGTTWHMDMFDTDNKGFISATGETAGGHAYLLKGVNTKKTCPDGSKGAVRVINSWGPNWGQNGKAWLSLVDLKKLIDDWGEACVATEVKKT